MSVFRWTNWSVRMCSMFASDPVSRLSTQITRLPRASSSSHRCDPRKPAPPVTRQVGITRNLSVRGRVGMCGALRRARDRPLHPCSLLLFPDRRLRLDQVKDLTCPGERLGAVGGGGGDRD